MSVKEKNLRLLSSVWKYKCDAPAAAVSGNMSDLCPLVATTSNSVITGACRLRAIGASIVCQER